MQALTQCIAIGLISTAITGCASNNILSKPDYPFEHHQAQTNRISDAVRIATVRIAQLNHSGGADCIPARMYRMQQLARTIRQEHEIGLNQEAALNLRILDQQIQNAEDGLAYLQINTACQQHLEDPRIIALTPLLEKITQNTFTSNSHTLPTSMPLQLDQLAHWLKTHPAYRITLIGHTDSQGEKEKNDLLALQRATALANYLRTQRVLNYQIKIDAQGEFNPISSNAFESMRYINRRVSLEVNLLVPSQKLTSKIKEWPSITDIWGGK